MSARLLRRPITRQSALRHALCATIGLSFGSAVLLKQQPRIRFDSRPIPRSEGSAVVRQERLDPELVRQLSGGSVTGFLSGLVISLFSRTLVLLLGVAVVVAQIASRYGLNIVDQLRLRQRIGSSRVLAALQKDPAFKLSFGLFFAMSAFMRF